MIEFTRYAPVSFVVTFEVTPDSALMMRTVAPGIGASDRSRITPVMLEEPVCAQRKNCEIANIIRVLAAKFVIESSILCISLYVDRFSRHGTAVLSFGQVTHVFHSWNLQSTALDCG